MMQEYIRQVLQRLPLRRRQKKEIERDLIEAFASAKEHGESAKQVIERLGNPEEFAKAMAEQFGDDKKKGRAFRVLGLVGSFGVAAACVALFLLSRFSPLPDNVIGYAEAKTSIQVFSSFDPTRFFLAIGTLAVMLGLVQVIWYRRKR